MASDNKGKGSHGWPIPKKPSGPVNPGGGGNNPPPAPGVPLIWWTQNADGRLKPDDQGKTDAEKANVGIATLIIQRDDGTLWRVGEDKAPYTWTQLAPGGGGGEKDPYTSVYPSGSDIAKPFNIKAWDRVVDDGFGRTYQLPDLRPGESFEIIDVMQIFDRKPVTVIKDPEDHFGFLLGKRDYVDADGKLIEIDGTESSITLDVTGEGSVWRFVVVNGDIVTVIAPTFSERVSYG